MSIEGTQWKSMGSIGAHTSSANLGNPSQAQSTRPPFRELAGRRKEESLGSTTGGLSKQKSISEPRPKTPTSQWATSGFSNPNLNYSASLSDRKSLSYRQKSSSNNALGAQGPTHDPGSDGASDPARLRRAQTPSSAAGSSSKAARDRIRRPGSGNILTSQETLVRSLSTSMSVSRPSSSRIARHASQPIQYASAAEMMMPTSFQIGTHPRGSEPELPLGRHRPSSPTNRSSPWPRDSTKHQHPAAVPEDISCLRKKNRPVLIRKSTKSKSSSLVLPPWNPSTRVQGFTGTQTNAPDSDPTKPGNDGGVTPMFTTEASRPSKAALQSTADSPSKGSVPPQQDDSEEQNHGEPPEHEFDALEFEEPLPQISSKRTYPITVKQTDLYWRIHPSEDEADQQPGEPKRTHPEFSYYRVQGYSAKAGIDVVLLAKAVEKVVRSHEVLNTYFYRNLKIVDADIECILPSKDTANPATAANLIEEMYSAELSPERLTEIVHHWTLKNSPIEVPLKVLVIHYSRSGDEAERRSSIIVFCVSAMVADEITTTWISKEVFGLVKAGAAEKYVHKEGMSFLTYAEELDSRGQEKKAQNHFRNVCIETTREVLTPQEQDKAEAQYRKLSVEKASIQQQVLNLTKRKMELELELATIRNERMQIDLDSSNSSLSGTKFLDPVTYDILLITEEAKKNLIRTVLGEGLSESDITVLLDKNGIPGSLQEALGLDKMTLFSFGAITEDSFKDKEVPQRERRSVLALAEYVRNRIKECTQEQTKVKFTLERKYLKCQRDLDTCSTTLKSTQKALDHNDDMCIRLQHTLNPPVVEKRLRLVDLQGKAQDKRPKRMAEDFGEIYGFAPILIDTELTDNLKRFGEGWDSELRRHRKIGDEMHGDDDDELLDLGFLQPSVNEIDPQTGHPHIYSVGSIILGAFAIMLKHCTGMDKFLMGVTQSYRPTGLLAGPLTDTVPIKIDLSQKGGTFNTLFHRLSKSMYEGSIYGGSCGMAALEHSTHMQLLLEVRFEFIPAKETDGWLKNGMSVGDLLGQQDEVGEGLERLWTVSEHDPFDMKLTCVEAPTHIIGGITYRKDKYDMTHVTRWIDKLISTLQSIERAPRKVTINSLISRYYQSVWQGGSKENLVGSVQDLNDAHQRLSMVDIFSSQPQIVPDDQESAET